MAKTILDLRPDGPYRQARKKRNRAMENRQTILSLLRQRDGDNCGICGEPMAYDEMTIDHIIDVAAGGTHEADNVQLAHASCNYAAKRVTTRIYDQLESCQRGHDLTDPANVYVRPSGERNCRVCKREAQQGYDIGRVR